MRIVRLTIAAVFTAALCLGYAFFFNRDGLYASYSCWRHATNFTACFSNQPFDFSTDIEGIRYDGNTGNYIDASILYLGAYEKDILYFLRDTMKSAYSGRGVFVDIGANTGQHSMFMSRYSTEVHAFEPWEPVLRRFRRMVAKNHIQNIAIHPVGLGDKDSKEPFFKPAANNLGTGSFVKDFSSRNSYDDELEIQIGDEALAKAGVKSVALIKMDIEGYEKFALKGLRNTLSKDRPIVEFELTTNPASPASIKSEEELVRLFPQDYTFLVFSDESKNRRTGIYNLRPMNQFIRFDVTEQHDMVACPKEKTPFIALKGSGS